MRSPAALVASAALAALAAPGAAFAADPAPAGPAPVAAPPAAPLVYPMTPPPYAVPYGWPYAPPPAGAPWGRPHFVEGHASTAMRNAGIAFIALGATTTLVGMVFLIGAAQPCTAFVEGRVRPFQRGRREDIGVAREALDLCQTGMAPGAVAMAVGGGLGIVGVPLFVVGSKPAMVPVPAVEVGLGGASLRWSF